jgi:hypothetical protein
MKKISSELILLLFGLMLFTYNTYSQKSKYYYEYPTLLTYNCRQLDSIITDAINRAKQCEYYTKDLAFSLIFDVGNYGSIFGLSMTKRDSIYGDSVFFDIYTSHYRQDIFEQPPFFKILGYFKIKKHLFAVFCSYLDIEKQELFEKTKHKKKFIVNNSDKVKVIVKANYINWEYVFINNRFYLRKIYNDCLDN